MEKEKVITNNVDGERAKAAAAMALMEIVPDNIVEWYQEDPGRRCFIVMLGEEFAGDKMNHISDMAGKGDLLNDLVSHVLLENENIRSILSLAAKTLIKAAKNAVKISRRS